jgi:hypothetical protein
VSQRVRSGWALLLGVLLSGCATLSDIARAPVTPLKATDPARLVGRWEGEVDLTFPDRTLVVHGVSRKNDVWVAQIEYGTTGLYLNSVAGVVEDTGGALTLRFVTPLASAVRLTLHSDTALRGTFRLATEDQDRPIELKRVARGSEPVPSTALDRASKAAVAPPAMTRSAAARPEAPTVAAGPPLAASAEADLATALPKLLVGRWEGDLDFTVSARLLLIDSVKREGDAWVVTARSGVSEADLTPVPVSIDTITQDRIVVRYNTSFASRATLTLHTDGALRGVFRFAFEAKDRQLAYKRVATATAGPAEPPVPLAVTFRNPSDEAGVSDPSLIVTGTASSSKGIARVVMTLNGAEVHRQSESGGPRSVVVSVPVTFVAGSNTLTLTAAEPDGTVRQDVRTVIFTPAATAPVAPPPKVTREQWAVIIGAGQYHSAAIPRLRYAVPDAEAVYRTLIGPGGFQKDHVVLLTDNAERKPTLRNIRWALGTFLARSARKDDTVVIFFAGHGAPETDLRGAERDGLAKYLIPVDADPDDLYSTALPMDEITTIFERIAAERVVAFLDACYSGAAGGRTFASLKTRAVNVDDLFLERLTRSKGRAIITASRPTEVSIELTELGHGIFTYYLVQGLQGAADGNRDGIVSLQELYEYVEQQVAQKSRAVGGNQHPVMKGEMEGVWPLVRVPPRRP